MKSDANTIPFFLVDAFASQIFKGNPAAVCPLQKWLPDNILHAMAIEHNQSETAFFVQGDQGCELRWFTVNGEINLCGHATLGAAHVIFNHLDYASRKIVFTTRYSGNLTVTKEDDGLVLDLPSWPPRKLDHPPQEAVDGLGIQPKESWLKRDYMFVFDDEKEIEAIEPDFKTLGRLGRGQSQDAPAICVTAPGRSCDFVSRFFCPGDALEEDPVTGSAHSMLVPYWSQRLNKNKLFARQLSRRGGELHCTLDGDRVLLKGQVQTYLIGSLFNADLDF